MTKALEYISSALQRNTTKFFVPAKFLTQEDLILINRQILTFKGDYLREIRCPDCGSKVAIEATSGPDGELRYTYLCTGCDCLEDRPIAPQEVDLLQFNLRRFNLFINDQNQSGEYVDEAARCLPIVSVNRVVPPVADKGDKEEPVEDRIATKVVAKFREQPIKSCVVEVAPSAGKSLRAAIKDPGGRPKRTTRGAQVMTQAEMARAFGEPCNTQMVSNWEARAAGKQRGANPPDAVYKGERIFYTAEIRKNPTPENKNRLTALITEFQSRRRIKEAISQKTIHCKSDETLAQASGQIDESIRERSHLKNGE